MSDEEEKSKGVVVDYVDDDLVVLIFVRSDDGELLVVPLIAPPFKKWMVEKHIVPDDLIGKRIEFDDTGLFEFSDADDEGPGEKP